MHFDRHENLPDHSYKVASIYFEDHGLTSYHEKLEGQPYRKKVRVRFYPQSNLAGGNLEIKYKKLDQGFKSRIALSESVMKNLLNGNIDEIGLTVDATIAEIFSGVTPFSIATGFMILGTVRFTVYAWTARKIEAQNAVTVVCLEVVTLRLHHSPNAL